MGGSIPRLAGLLRDDPALSALYARLPGGAADADDTRIAVDAAKALAAFQETLVAGRTLFDRFRDGLAAGDMTAVAAYTADALRGLRLFVGRGNCGLCHAGPAFSHGEFEDVAVGYFLERGRVDAGRAGGIDRLRASPFTRTGPWNDGGDDRATRHLAPQHRDFGLFKVPSLRNVAATAPYMHNGMFTTLEEVIDYYDQPNQTVPDAFNRDTLLNEPLSLTPVEKADLKSFLEALTDDRVKK